MEFLSSHAELVTVALFLVAYLGLSLWKFKRPESELGRAALSALIRISVFALNQWGARNPRIPLTISEEEVQKELDSLETKKLCRETSCREAETRRVGKRGWTSTTTSPTTAWQEPRRSSRR